MRSKMLFASVALPAFALPLVAGSITRTGTGARLQPRAGDKAGFPYDDKTTEYCTYWIDNDGSELCEEIPEFYEISMEDFVRWNPSVTVDCDNYQTDRSYCVEALDEPALTSSSASASQVHTVTQPQTSTSSTKSSSTTTTSTKPTNGISTPSPTQPDMVDNCNKFYFVKRGDSCTGIASSNGISLTQFVNWNPKAGKGCTGLWADTYACVSVIGTKPTPVDPGNGIATPTPTQPGMVKNCNKFYKVVKGDNCDRITAKNGIPLDDFIKFNPQIGGKACSGLWQDTYVCVGTIGYKPQPPTLPDMVKNCDKLYKAESGHTCEKIVKKYGSFTVNEFYMWNPSVRKDCTGLMAGTQYCVGVPMAFHLKTRYHADCTGDMHNEVTVGNNDGLCINTDCKVASMEIASAGSCPGGQVQISYWEKPGCQGKWFGYGYASRGQCRKLWTEGWKFKAVHLRCAKQQDDCVSKGTCKYDAEPARGVCG